jgi:hypothetical protein
MPMIADNDNAPQRADSFASNAHRRAWLASLPMPKNDSDIAPVLGCPTLARLSKAGDSKAAVLVHWSVLMRPLHEEMALCAANDNSALSPESLLDIRPTVNELMAAAGRVCVRSTRSASRKWSQPTRHRHQLVVGKHKGGRGAVGQNEIVGWFDHKGIERRASVKLAAPKGSAGKSRSAADIARYLDRPGSPFPPQVLAFDGGREIERTYNAIASQAVLEQAIANTSVLPQVTKYPTVIAKGAHWVGGVVGSTRRGGRLDAAAVEAELARGASARRLRSKMGDGTASILDMASTRMTASEIGREFGYTGKYAERWAVRAIDAALAKIAA